MLKRWVKTIKNHKKHNPHVSRPTDVNAEVYINNILEHSKLYISRKCLLSTSNVNTIVILILIVIFKLTKNLMSWLRYFEGSRIIAHGSFTHNYKNGFTYKRLKLKLPGINNYVVIKIILYGFFIGRLVECSRFSTALAI